MSKQKKANLLTLIIGVVLTIIPFIVANFVEFSDETFFTGMLHGSLDGMKYGGIFLFAYSLAALFKKEKSDKK